MLRFLSVFHKAQRHVMKVKSTAQYSHQRHVLLTYKRDVGSVVNCWVMYSLGVSLLRVNIICRAHSSKAIEHYEEKDNDHEDNSKSVNSLNVHSVAW